VRAPPASNGPTRPGWNEEGLRQVGEHERLADPRALTQGEVKWIRLSVEERNKNAMRVAWKAQRIVMKRYEN
jgi:hypothetical protein